MLEARECPNGISILEASMADVVVEGVECIISSSTCFVAWRLHVRLDNLLEATELPTGLSALPGLTEEGVDSIVSSTNGFVAWRLDIVLEAREFPTGISTLDASIADVDVEGVECH